MRTKKKNETNSTPTNVEENEVVDDISKDNYNEEYKLSEEEENERLEEMGEPLVRASIDKTNIDKKPYYEHPAFDWDVKRLWINDQNAVNYWFKHVRNKSQYPDDFSSKTY